MQMLKFQLSQLNKIEFISSAKKNNLICIDLIESFDTLQNDENPNIPRLLSILFKKN